jgi:hypothetical protein
MIGSLSSCLTAYMGPRGRSIRLRGRTAAEYWQLAGSIGKTAGRQMAAFLQV